MKKILISLSLLLFALTSMGQIEGNFLKVEGKALVYATPEMMEINIPVEVKTADYEACSKKLTDVFQKLVSELTANGIEKEQIKTHRLKIEENTKWIKNERVHDGYIASLNVSIQQKYTPNNINIIINTLMKNQFKFGYRVDFYLSEKQKSDLLKQTIENAIKDAKNKAKIIAKNLDLRLLKVKEINFGKNNFFSANDDEIIPVTRQFTTGSSGKLNLNPKQISIAKTIYIIWKIAK